MLNCMNTTHHRHFEHYVSESKYISLQDCSKEKKIATIFFVIINELAQAKIETKGSEN